jgi:hypothetical protein
MLEQRKELLQQLSHDSDLFRQEIIQSFRWLKSYEIILLHAWLKQNFDNTHRKIIKDVFEYIAA